MVLTQRNKPSLNSHSESPSSKRASINHASDSTHSQTSRASEYDAKARDLGVEDSMHLGTGAIPDVPITETRQQYIHCGCVSAFTKTDDLDVCKTSINVPYPISSDLKLNSIQPSHDTPWNGAAIEASSMYPLSFGCEAERIIIPYSHTEFPWAIKLGESDYFFSNFGEGSDSAEKNCRCRSKGDDDTHSKIIGCWWFSSGSRFRRQTHTFAFLNSQKWANIMQVQNHLPLTDMTRMTNRTCTTIMKSPRYYRMSLNEIGRPLNTFKSSHELVTTMADAMEAHEIAYHDAGLLHRDISPHNILITEQGRGILIDWDLSMSMNCYNRRDQIGTPEFWSVALLTNRNHVQGVLDDQESALYVLLWSLLRYTQHNQISTLREQLGLFDIEPSASSRKEVFLLSWHRDLDFHNHPRLKELITEIAFTFYVRYAGTIGSALRAFLEKAADIMDDPCNQVVRERNIANRSWLVRTMRKYLEPRHEWPSDDAARENPINTRPRYYY